MPDHSPRQPRYGRRVRGFRYDRPRHKRESGGLHRRRPTQAARRGGDAGVRTGPSRFGLKVRKGGLHYCQNVIIVLIWLFNSLNVLREYERGVIFRIGRLMGEPKGPGLIWVIWPIDRIVRVSLRTITMDVPTQDVITKDNVSVKVNAVVYFRVVAPIRAIVEVENYLF